LRRRLEGRPTQLTNLKDFTMANRTVEQIVNVSADALNESGNASRVALQELAKTYQDLATKTHRL
jgi:hypothetical protein